MHGDVKKNGAHRTENGKHAKHSDKKAYLKFEEFFSVLDVVIYCMYQCMKNAEFKALQFGTKIIKIPGIQQKL